ncbi:hypothetical protein MKL26_01950 [Streptococcus suis]|nr:hypothetical protein [Streptococcus suis]
MAVDASHAKRLPCYLIIVYNVNINNENDKSLNEGGTAVFRPSFGFLSFFQDIIFSALPNDMHVIL